MASSLHMKVVRVHGEGELVRRAEDAGLRRAQRLEDHVRGAGEPGDLFHGGAARWKFLNWKLNQKFEN